MSRRGACWDNAVTESFFGTLKTELIYVVVGEPGQVAKDAVAGYIEAFYNSQRSASGVLG